MWGTNSTQVATASPITATYSPYPERQWFQLEPPGPSRWNTCRALRVLQRWDR